MKNIIKFIIQPMNFFGGKHFAESVSNFFSKHKILIFVLSIFVTAIIIFSQYVYPFITG